MTARARLPKRLLILDAVRREYRLRSLVPTDTAYDYMLLGGEALCQYLLREDPAVMVIARGPMVFLPGNKATIGYVSPLTGLPHYSFVGGRAFAQLLNLGLDAIVLSGADETPASHYAVIRGRAPALEVQWRDAGDLPSGQRSAYYRLVAQTLQRRPEVGSVFTLGEAAGLGYRSANVLVDGLYHAGRGGAGHVFARFCRALILAGQPTSMDAWLGDCAGAVRELAETEIQERLETYCSRFSCLDGGTIKKLFDTGAGSKPTLPRRNAQRLGYELADHGARKVLRSSRAGQTGCQWCHVHCRHWHWVPVDYAPNGRDAYLDDFEPAYAVLAMLDLRPEGDDLKAWLKLLEEVDQALMVEIEQMGCDVIDLGVGLAGLFEGLEAGLIPPEDVPPFMRSGPWFGQVRLAARALAALREGEAWPALRALGDGPQALATRYPAMADRVFTSGPGTFANAGHSNALWTFLMPFSRFFGHYSSQIYKIPGDLSPAMAPPEVVVLFERVIAEMLRREQFGCLGNALSTCAFTFVIFSEDGLGIELDRSDLLVRLLSSYGIACSRDDLLWFAEAFWAQSIAMKLAHGWRPPSADALPLRVYESLSPVLGRSPTALRDLMDGLIAEWKRQTGQIMRKWGHATDHLEEA